MANGAPVAAVFALIAVGMVIYGGMSVIIVWRTPWGPGK
jgi:hypothetical protein